MRSRHGAALPILSAFLWQGRETTHSKKIALFTSRYLFLTLAK
jgi:hypothetical protein